MHLTSKIVLDKRYKTINGSYPLKLRVYDSGSFKELSLKISISETNWDEIAQYVLPTDAESDKYNKIILSKRSHAKTLIDLAEINNDTAATPSVIIASLSNKAAVPKIAKQSLSFIKYGQQISDDLKKVGKVGNAIVYSCAISKFKSYVNRDTLTFAELDYKKLNDFRDSMLAEGIKVNTISVYLRTLRAVYNKAIREGVVNATSYPFRAFTIKNEKTANRSLTLLEIKAITAMQFEPNTPIWHWRNYFLLSFCLIGMNFTDLLMLTGDNIIDGRIVYRRKKTGKIYSIKLHQKAIEIFANYTSVKGSVRKRLLLPVINDVSDPVKLKNDISQAIKTCNEYLVRIAVKLSITKQLSTYYARYTWAGMARTLGYSKEVISQGLGHSYGNATTSIYLDDYDNEMIDEANAKVIAAVFK